MEKTANKIALEKAITWKMSGFRFESFGDLNNTLQVKNYFLIAEQNPHCTMALWTKNPWIIADAMEEYGLRKPDNVIIILSSVLLNVAMDAEQVAKKYPFINKIFTVYDKEHAKDVTINCGSRSCAECQRCYHKSESIEYVNELLK